MLNHLLIFVVTFITIFLKGFQHKNVIGGHLKLMTITSYAMAFGDVLLIGIISKSGWEIGFSSGTGAALGMLCSVLLHDMMFKKG